MNDSYVKLHSMKRLKVALIAATALALGMVSTVSSHSAPSYTLNLTIVDEDATTNVALYDDEGDQSASHGRKKCSSAKLMWLNPDPISTSDIIRYQKIGNKSKIKVKNDSGKIVGIGTLSVVGWKEDRVEENEDPEIGTVVYGTCTYSQKIKVSKSNFYSIEFSGTNVEVPSFDIALSDLIKKKWKLTLTI
jgi:hypothetical protein